MSPFPEFTQPIKTEKGEGLILKIDIFKDTFTVKYQSGEVEVLPPAVSKEKVYKCGNDCGPEQGNWENVGND